MKKTKRGILCCVLAMAIVTSLFTMQTSVFAQDGGDEGSKFTPSKEFYVAVNGNDENDGSIARPFATLETARDVVRKIKENTGLPTGGIAINIRGGNYQRINDSFSLSEDDSGTATSPIVYRAYNNEEVNFLGGMKVNTDKFVKISDQSILNRLSDTVEDKILVYDIKAENGITTFGQNPKNGFGWPALPPASNLVVEGKLQSASRYPNTGFINISSIQNKGFVPRSHYANGDGTCPECSKGAPSPIKCKFGGESNFINQEGGTWTVQNQTLAQKTSLWQQEAEVWVAGYFCWAYADDSMKIKSIQPVTGGMKMTSVQPSRYGVGGGDASKFYAFNLLCEIDQPGEWYLDVTNAKLYYYPTDDLTGKNSYLSINDKPIIHMENTNYVKIQNLKFSSSRSHGIQMLDCENNTISGCNFSDLGQQAVVVGTGLKDIESVNSGARGGKNNTVESCNITRMGQGGIFLGGGNRMTLEQGNNKAINNDISDFSVIKRTYTPAVALVGCGNICSNNLIYNSPHTAITYDGNDFLISNNDISNVCYETSDVGAIYACRRWSYRGVKIKNNYIHDLVTAGGTGSAAIYIDDLTSGAIATNNLLVNIPGYITLFGGGRDNVFKNNIVLNNGNGNGIHHDARGTGWATAVARVPNGECYTELIKLPYTTEPWASKYPELASINLQTKDAAGNLIEARKPAGAIIKDNILVGVANPTGNIAQMVKDLGTVENNISYKTLTDVGFTDSANSNYTIKDGSIIRQIMGKDCFDISTVGLYQDQFRTIVGKPMVEPKLTVPTNNATDISILPSVKLAWGKVENAQKYKVMVSTDEQFNNIVYLDNITEIQSSVNGLKKNTKYFWKVIAFNKMFGGDEVSSQTYNFTTSQTDASDFIDSFENESATGWEMKLGISKTSTEQKETGNRSFKLDEDQDVICKTFSETTAGTVSVLLYDNLNKTNGTTAVMNVSLNNTWFALGVNALQSKDTYITRVGTNWIKSNIARTMGWHELKWDFTSGKDGKAYIDGILVYTLANTVGFNKIEIGDFWADSNKLISNMYFDDVKISIKYDIPAESIKIDPTTAKLAIGKTIQLKYLITPIVSKPKLNWMSKDPEIARVDENGLVTANRVGTTTITVSLEGTTNIFATCTVTVS